MARALLVLASLLSCGGPDKTDHFVPDVFRFRGTIARSPADIFEGERRALWIRTMQQRATHALMRAIVADRVEMCGIAAAGRNGTQQVLVVPSEFTPSDVSDSAVQVVHDRDDVPTDPPSIVTQIFIGEPFSLEDESGHFCSIVCTRESTGPGVLLQDRPFEYFLYWSRSGDVKLIKYFEEWTY